MRNVAETLTSLSLGSPAVFSNLTVFPLSGGPTHARAYIGLSEAVQRKTATVSEVSHGGSVPELLLSNLGKQAVLVLDGEELLGAKQNRTANVTVLAAPGTTVRIPVTCVEAGRWSYQSHEFATSEQVHFHKGRRRKMESVSRSLKATGSRAADQSEVWSDISDKCEAMAVDSPTRAMADVYDSHRSRVEDYVAAFAPQPGQTGAVFAIGDHIEGLELFDCEQTLAEMLPKLVRSYAIDAIELQAAQPGHPAQPSGASPGSAKAFIEQLALAQLETYPGVGLGTELRLKAPGAIAGGLAWQERIVHLAAFAVAAEPRQRGAGSSEGMLASRVRRRRMGR